MRDRAISACLELAAGKPWAQTFEQQLLGFSTEIYEHVDVEQAIKSKEAHCTSLKQALNKQQLQDIFAWFFLTTNDLV